MNEMVKRLMQIGLRNKGFTDVKYDSEKDAMFLGLDSAKIEIYQDEIRFPKITEVPSLVHGQQWESLEEVNAYIRNLVYGILRPIQNSAVEITTAWDKAKPMPIEDVSKFRSLSEYNNIVLAARDDGSYGLHFVTWRYTHNRQCVEHGNYTNDYEKSKKDFAIRSGLIREKEVFDTEQLKQIYSALLFQGQNDCELTYDMGKELHTVIEKLENICPDLMAEPLQSEQEQEFKVEPAIE